MKVLLSVVLLLILVFTSGCGGGGSGGGGSNAAGDSSDKKQAEIQLDTDRDGVKDKDDLWPTDPSKPVVSKLWGVNGESWDTDARTEGIQSRLPFYGFAGYRDGSDLPVPECTLDVSSFGAIADDDIDDTDAFWNAIAQATQSASANNLVVICIPSGTFELSKQLHLSQSGLVLRGSGREQTVLNYKQGMIAQTYPEFIGNVTSDWDSNKAIVLGNSDGLAWSNSIYLNQLNDLSLLPKEGDIKITLPRALSASELTNLHQSGNRIRLFQHTHYSNRDSELRASEFTAGIYGGASAKNRVQSQIISGVFEPQYNEFTPMKFLSGHENYTQGHYEEYKYGHGTESVSQQFVVSYTPGSTTMTLDRPLRFSMTSETSKPKLQLIDNTKTMYTDIGIEDLTIKFPETAWKDCTEALEGYPCTESAASHGGYWAQGGIELLSDYSWVKNVKFQNAGNPLKMSGDFNTAIKLIIDSNRPTTESTFSVSSPIDVRKYQKISTVGHVGIAAHGSDNLIDDIVIRANFIHTLSMAHSQGVVFSNVRAEQPQAHPTDSYGHDYVKINLDHHRQIIHSTLWTNIHLGDSGRMWDSTGNITEGFNSAANNTYWGINSSSSHLDYWPHNRKGSVEWGYHYINIVGTNIQQKPPVPQHTDISELPYPYANKNPELNPFPYHPDNAHLESISPELIWPSNLYYAQREAYNECKLTIKPKECSAAVPPVENLPEEEAVPPIVETPSEEETPATEDPVPPVVETPSEEETPPTNDSSTSNEGTQGENTTDTLEKDNIYQAKKYDLEQETYSVDVLHEITDADDILNEDTAAYNAMVNYKGYTYMLYIVDSNDGSNGLRPKIVKISHADKTSTSAFIDLPDYHTRDDAHHKWSLGVDKNGYLHIAGDMHNYSIFGAGKDYVGYSVDHMPDRYKSGRVNYWKSDAPEDISSFTWYGDSATQAPQGTGHTYIHFAYDQEDNLYFYGRVAQNSAKGGWKAYRAFNISKYDAQTQTWSSLGEKNEFDNEALIWEDNGENGGSYSKIHGWVSFDLNNKMHAVAPILNKDITTTSPHLVTDIAYVSSDFGANNLLSADGHSLGNSLRVDGSNSFTQADIAHSNTTQLLATYASVVADYQGRPIVLSRVEGEKDNRFHRFENGMWVDHGTCGISGDNDSRLLSDRLGVITMIQDNESFTRMWSVDEGIRTVRVKYNLKALKSLNIDARHLMKTGEIIAIANRSDKVNDPLQIVRIKITRPSEISYPADESL